MLVCKLFFLLCNLLQRHIFNLMKVTLQKKEEEKKDDQPEGEKREWTYFVARFDKTESCLSSHMSSHHDISLAPSYLVVLK